MIKGLVYTSTCELRSHEFASYYAMKSCHNALHRLTLTDEQEVQVRELLQPFRPNDEVVVYDMHSFRRMVAKSRTRSTFKVWGQSTGGLAPDNNPPSVWYNGLQFREVGSAINGAAWQEMNLHATFDREVLAEFLIQVVFTFTHDPDSSSEPWAWPDVSVPSLFLPRGWKVLPEALVDYCQQAGLVTKKAHALANSCPQNVLQQFATDSGVNPSHDEAICMGGTKVTAGVHPAATKKGGTPPRQFTTPATAGRLA